MPTAALASRSAVLGDAPEPALAPVVGQQRPVDLVAVEVGPVCGSAVVLGVGRLPEQEVREAHLSCGADDQVGVRQARRIEVSGEHVFVDSLRRDPFGDDPAGRLHDLSAAAVVECDRHR